MNQALECSVENWRCPWCTESPSFAEEEIDGMVAFYKTTAGHAKSMEIGRRQMVGIMPEIQKTVEELKQKYKNAPKQ